MGDYWLSCNAPDSEKAVKFFESASAAKSVGVLQFAKMGLGISKLQLGDMEGIHDLEAAADMGVLLAKALCASLLYSPDMPDETRLRIGELVCEVTDSESGKKLQEMEIHEASDGLPADFPMPATDRIAFAKIKVVSGTAALDGINLYDKEPARIEADSLFATDEFKTAALFGDREGLQGYRELETPEFAEETIAEWRVRGNPWIDNIDQRKEL